MAGKPDAALEEQAQWPTEEDFAKRREALRHVRQWGDPLLRSPTSEVTAFDDALAREAERMESLMDDAIGCGLAAPQVGSLKRMFVYRAEREGPATAVINPRITWRSDEEELGLEGCLSLGEVTIEVPRAVSIKLEYQELDGTAVEVEASGFEARVIQHEYDHLDGVLTIDRAGLEERREALRILSGQEPA